jgi:nitrate reductase gamma subunit
VIDDFVLFGVLPYVALVVFLVVSISRYRTKGFSYSSLSSQFLENQNHFWGSVPFHYGVLGVLAGHLLAVVAPGAVLGWNAEPLRLMALELTGLALALLTLVGLVNIVIRRLEYRLARRVTTALDWLVYALLLLQVVSGIGIAVVHGWGSSWFATNLTPWLWSLARLAPEVGYVVPLPWLVKLHIASAFVLIGLFPFTRLVHVLVVPNPYLWRKTQVVIWNLPRMNRGQGA